MKGASMAKTTGPLPVPPAANAENLKAQSPEPASSRSVTHQEIQTRAYQNWEAKGKPAGMDLKFWLEAQRELLQRK
jgi:hypothetical protein